MVAGASAAAATAGDEFCKDEHGLAKIDSDPVSEGF